MMTRKKMMLAMLILSTVLVVSYSQLDLIQTTAYARNDGTYLGLTIPANVTMQYSVYCSRACEAILR